MGLLDKIFGKKKQEVKIEYVIPLEDRFPFPKASFDNKKESQIDN